MNKLVLVLILLLGFLLLPVSVFAENHLQVKEHSKLDLDLLPSLPATVSARCNETTHWKNHGEFVSCVAHLHPGGNIVSVAAKSDVGKTRDEMDATPSATPTATSSATTTVTVNNNMLQKLVDAINNLIQKLQEIFHVK